MDLDAMTLEDLNAMNRRLHDEEEAIRTQRRAVADEVRKKHARMRAVQALESAGLDASAIAAAFPERKASASQ